eukprot:19743-Heterococcus_DN1.PRE.2
MARPLSSLPASVLSSREASAPGTALATSGTCQLAQQRAHCLLVTHVALRSVAVAYRTAYTYTYKYEIIHIYIPKWRVISSALAHSLLCRAAVTAAGVTSSSRSIGANAVTSSSAYSSTPTGVAQAHSCPVGLKRTQVVRTASIVYKVYSRQQQLYQCCIYTCTQREVQPMLHSTTVPRIYAGLHPADTSLYTLDYKAVIGEHDSSHTTTSSWAEAVGKKPLDSNS